MFLGSLKEIINTNPKFSKALVRDHVFESDPLVVLDVGARAGFESHWSLYGEQARLIGIEPDEEECARLQNKNTSTANSFYPVALGSKPEERRFFHARWPASSGLYPPDQRFWARFPDRRNLEIVGEGTVSTVDWDSFSTDNAIRPIDFIKLDVEGAELDVLDGAQKELSESICGISIEIEFLEGHKGRPVFADVDAYLRSRGFVLFDLLLRHHARNGMSPFEGGGTPRFTSSGQLIWGQAVYFRDAVEEMSNPSDSSIEWTQIKLLKLASLFELVRLNDCAAELLIEARDRKLIPNKKCEDYCDLLVPEEGVSFAEYPDLIRRRYERSERARLLARQNRRHKRPGLRGLIPESLLPQARWVRNLVQRNS